MHEAAVCSLSTGMLEAGMARKYNDLNEQSKAGLSKTSLLSYFWNSLRL